MKKLFMAAVVLVMVSISIPGFAGDIDAPVVFGSFPVSGVDAYVGRLVRAGN